MAQRHLNSSSMATLVAIGDPLEFLPYEIWLLCIRFAILDSTEGPLAFMSISRRWDQAILEEPELWTRIVINRGEDEAARLYTFLELSRGRPLDLKFMHTNGITISMQVLMFHAQRIHSMTISDTEFYQNREKSIIQWFTEEAPHYPSMIDLDFQFADRNPPPEWTELISIFPNLQAISGVLFPIHGILSSKIQRVDYIRLNTLEDGLAFVQSQNLRSAHVTYPGVERNISDEEWTSHARHLHNCTYGQLRQLLISLELRRIGILSQLLPRLPLLHSFTLSITSSELIPDIWAVQPLLVEHIMHIRSLKIVEYTRWDVDSPPPIFQTAVQMFTTNNSLEYVEDLKWEMYVGIEESSVYSLLRGLTRVRRLDLTLRSIERRNMSPKTVRLDYVRFLKLFPSYLFDYIEAPNVVTLRLYRIHDDDVMTYRRPTPSISQLEIDTTELDFLNINHSVSFIESQWQELQTIYLSGLGWSTTAIYMKSLTTVSISDHRGMLDYFILELLRNPKALPNLHTIKSFDYPMWEPLFELLRRRNRDGLSIKQLTLAIYPAPAILSRLVMLLQGRQDVYTQRDIEDMICSRFRDLITELKICGLCASAGYIACPSGGWMDATLDRVDFGLLDLWSHEPGARYQICDSEKWNQVMSGNRLRGLRDVMYENMAKGQIIGDCGRRNPRNVDITGSMLIDVAPPWHTP